jgi:hypothetical protein
MQLQPQARERRYIVEKITRSLEGETICRKRERERSGG